ncbi:MAG: TonB-dependent receptor [Chryseolinea sp.]
MKSIFTLILLISMALFDLKAQESCFITLSGKISSTSGEPLPGATISLVDLNTGGISGNDGLFKIKNLCKRKYRIEVKYVGYEDKILFLKIEKSIEIEVVLTESNQMLEEVVIADQYQHVEQNQTASVLSGTALEETKGMSLGESLKELSGVSSIQTGPSIFKPVIHGVHSQRILILNNGIRQEGQQWGAEHAPEIDPFIASNIVVIKDAGAIKYGTDALGGVVIVNPPDLPTTNTLGGELNLIGQSNGRSGTVSGTLEGGSKRFKGFGWRVQGTGKKSGDFHAPDYILSNTGYNELNYSLTTGYHKEDVGIELFYSHFKTEIGILRGSSVETVADLKNALEREPPAYTKDFTYDLINPHQDVKHDLLKLNAHKRVGNNEYTIQYGLQLNRRKEFDVRKGKLYDIPSIDLQLITHTVDMEWENSKEKTVRCIGINGMLQDNNNIDGTYRIPFIPNFNSTTIGVYAIQKVNFKKWILDGGIRYDYRYSNVAGYDFKNALYRSTLKFHNASLTVGANRKVRKNGMYITSLASAWRPPHVAELYSFGRHQSAAAVEYGLLLDDSTKIIDINNSNFKNEKALKWVNTYQYNTDKLLLEATVYYNYIFNYIYLKPTGVTTTFTGPTPYFRYRQTDASFLGSDFSINYQVIKKVKLGAKTSLLRAADEKNNTYLYFIPSNRFEMNIRFEEPQLKKWKSFYVESKLKFTAKQNRAPVKKSIDEIIQAEQAGETLPPFDFASAPDGYFLWNVSMGISYPVNKSKMDFKVGVTNILNTSYREYTNRMRYYADDVGRNISFAVKYSF